MPRNYTITLSEEDILVLKDIVIAYRDSFYLSVEHKEIVNQLLGMILEAYQKPYTNFDKIKDEMTIDRCANDLLDSAFSHKEWCKNCDKDKYVNCYPATRAKRLSCVRKWLESEVKK